MPILEPWQFNLVFNFLSITIAGMGGAFIFFVLTQSQLSKGHRIAHAMSAVIVAIAFYHYIQIFNSWSAAFTLTDGVYTPSGEPFNDAYRYADWLLTVPLLIAELVLVLHRKVKTAFVLGGAALLMIALGYPGEMATSTGPAMLFWMLSMIPFLYIVFVLIKDFLGNLSDVPEGARGPAKATIKLLIISWFFYPIAYLIGAFSDSAMAEVGMQIGYSVADLVAKAVYGVCIFNVALAMTRAEEEAEA